MAVLEPVAGFRMDLPVTVTFGEGVVSRLPELIPELGGRRCAVVLEPPVAAIPGVSAALESCERSGIRIEQLLKAAGEPTFAAATDAQAWLQKVDPDVLVAFGGGSTMDLAKAARLLASQGGPL